MGLRITLYKSSLFSVVNLDFLPMSQCICRSLWLIWVFLTVMCGLHVSFWFMKYPSGMSLTFVFFRFPSKCLGGPFRSRLLPHSPHEMHFWARFCNYELWDIRFTTRCIRGLCSSELLRGAGRLMVTEVSYQPAPRNISEERRHRS